MRGIAPKLLPSVEAGDKSFGIGVGSGRQLDKTVVPASAVKSPEPLVGRGMAQGRPESSISMRTGMKKASGCLTVTGAPSAIFAGSRGVAPIMAKSAGST
jgi:hypothetical protein